MLQQKREYDLHLIIFLKNFSDFLENSSYTDHWSEYTNESPTLEEQFLDIMNLKRVLRVSHKERENFSENELYSKLLVRYEKKMPFFESMDRLNDKDSNYYN